MLHMSRILQIFYKLVSFKVIHDWRKQTHSTSLSLLINKENRERMESNAKIEHER